MIARNAPWTMRRDTGYGATYVGTAVLRRSGLHGAGKRSASFRRTSSTSFASACSTTATSLQRLQEFAFATQANFTEVLYEDREDLAVAYQQGLCDAVSASASWLNAHSSQRCPIRRSQRILPERISKAVFGPVVRAGDDAVVQDRAVDACSP